MRPLHIISGLTTSAIGLLGMIASIIRMSEGQGGIMALVACLVLSLVGAAVIWNGGRR